MNFVLNAIADLPAVCEQSAFSETTPELVESILAEAARFAAGVLAPLNTVGDLIGTRIVDDQVRETSGFSEAYQQFVDAGWNALACRPEYGGMGLPECVGIAVMEMWSAANVSFGLCPLLGQGAIEALQSHASPEMRERYLAKMISGQWTGTMNLTEPQAGSDLAAIRTRATPEGDAWRIRGTKIFITWGDHQMTENIVHLVLARVDGAPAGTRGISLFLVPKFLVGRDGTVGERNDVHAVSVEHKMGIHGSPTCVMNYGGSDNSDGALGFLIGEENMGLHYMFTMMNHARLNVGVQGMALADRAFQQALGYARERIQGTPAGRTEPGPILHHPDVQRMLMLMRVLTEGSRALCYRTAACFDMGHHADDPDQAASFLKRGELLTPIAKAWSTEVSQEVTSLGVQVHGGMGYIEETGAAQFMRDARITTIYEGTTGIQANDFTGRKVIRDSGRELYAVLSDIRNTVSELEGRGDLASTRSALHHITRRLEKFTDAVLKEHGNDAVLTAGVAFNYLMATGTCIAGWLLARAAIIASGTRKDDPAFVRSRLDSSEFYAVHVMPRAAAYLETAESTRTLVDRDFFS